MPQLTRYLLHDQGPALWPDHKPIEEILELQATTPIRIWEGTYQGNPTPPEGTVFMRSWWDGKNRYNITDRPTQNKVIARWISWDTALKDKEDDAYSARVVGELLPDYRMIIREVWRKRLPFPDLPEEIHRSARKYARDGKLRGVIIEDKVSGTSAFQTLSKQADSDIADLLIAFMPPGGKETRAEQAAVWCKQDCVMLPHPDQDAFWLYDFEDELFDFPGTTFADQVDAFSQLIIWTENLLAEGYHARSANRN